MKCPYCELEMKTGTTQLALMSGTFAMFSYVPDEQEEKPEQTEKKGIFKYIQKSNAVEKSVMNFTKSESYYCPKCNILMPVVK